MRGEAGEVAGEGSGLASSEGGETKDDLLASSLAEYLDIPGITAAILVSSQGLTISSVTKGQVDTTSIAALVVDTVASGEQFGLRVRAGELKTMTAEFEHMVIVLAPFTADVILALVAEPGSIGVGTVPLRPRA